MRQFPLILQALEFLVILVTSYTVVKALAYIDERLKRIADRLERDDEVR